MKSFSLVFFLFFQASFAGAFYHKPLILVPAMQADPEDVKRFYEGRSQLISYTKYLNEEIPLENQKERLLDLFEAAQIQYFKNQQLSRPLYKKVINESYLQDWGPMERLLISQAFLKLAEMSLTIAQRNHWLQQALAFNPEIHLSSLGVSVKTKNSFQKLKSQGQLSLITWTLPKQLTQMSFLKVNGQKIDLENKDTLSFFPGTYRLSFASNTSAYQYVIIKTGALKDLEFHNLPLVKGSCQHPHLQHLSAKLLSQVIVYFSPHCIKKFNGIQWVSINPQNFRGESLNINGKNSLDFSQVSLKKKTPTIKPWWIISGLGVLGSFFLISQKKKKVIRRQH